MKKSLVLAMAMALGVTASAYAANPFSDVPEGHWAYDSISKLAAAGVIDGYADATFGGDKLMTRYEMAQITAKAMAKGANVDKLAAEFAEELDNLGVRVANLEKKADNVKIAGNIRYEYASRDGDVKKWQQKRGKAETGVAKHRLRSRLYISGQINEDWNYTARITNDQNLHNSSGDEDTYFDQACVSGKLGGVKVLAGKTDLFLANGMLYDDTADMVSLTYGKDVKVNAYYGKPTGNNYGGAGSYGYDEVMGASVTGKLGNLTLGAGYDKFKDANGENGQTFQGNFEKNGADNGVWNVSAGYKINNDLTLNAIYLHSDIDKSDINFHSNPGKDPDTDGYVIGLNYKGANRNKIGSWGLWANYYDQGVGTTVAHTMYTGDWSYFSDEGFKGFGVGGEVTVAKNMVAKLHYYDLEGKESDDDTQVLWARLQINF